MNIPEEFVGARVCRKYSNTSTIGRLFAICTKEGNTDYIQFLILKEDGMFEIKEHDDIKIHPEDMKNISKKKENKDVIKKNRFQIMDLE